MNRIKLQTYLDYLINRAKTLHDCPLHLCWFTDNLHCLPSTHTIDQHHVFFDLRKVHRTSGFTTDEWDLLTNKILKFLKE